MLKKILFFVLILLAIIIAAYVIVFKPYVKREYQRTSNEPTKIIAEYVNVTGDPLCTKFYLVEDGQLTGKGVFPKLPTDLADPHNKGLKDGDRISLTGYTYHWVTKNLITNNSTVRPVYMIDVLAWELITSSNASKSSTAFQSSIEDHSPENFMGENYTDCIEWGPNQLRNI